MRMWSKKKVGNISVQILMVCLLILCFETWSYKGILMYFAGVFIFLCWRVWKNREFVMSLMRRIEVIIWGKPLDKEYWEPGELKNTKVKIKWGKKKKL